jgi:hypothetical protein
MNITPIETCEILKNKTRFGTPERVLACQLPLAG